MDGCGPWRIITRVRAAAVVCAGVHWLAFIAA